MDASHGSKSWLDEWFPLLLIGLGIVFVAVLLLYNPTNAGSPGGSYLYSADSASHNDQEHGPGNR